MDKLKYLSRIQLFHELDLKQISNLAEVTLANIVKRKTLIVSPHLPQKRLFLVKSGMVRLYRISKTGKELTVDLLGEGNIFGEIELFTTWSDGLYAETVEDSIICSIDKVQFEEVVKAHPVLGLKMIEIISLRLKEVEEMLELMAYGSVRKRLLYLLYKLSQKFGRKGDTDEGWVQLEVKLTHQELASTAGSIRETVTEQLKNFESEGLISKDGLRSPISVQPERIVRAMEQCD